MGTYNKCLVPKCGGSVLLGSDGRHVCSLCAQEYPDEQLYGEDGGGPNHVSFGWGPRQRVVALSLYLGGRPTSEIAVAVGKHPGTVRKYFQRNPPGDFDAVRIKIADAVTAVALLEVNASTGARV